MPGMSCCVALCKSNFLTAKTTGEKVAFFSFPKDNSVRKQWVHNCYRSKKFDSKNKRICSKHFTEDDYEDALQAKLLGTTPKKLKKNAIPSMLLPKTLKLKSPTSRSQRAAKKQQKELIEELLSIPASNESSSVPATPFVGGLVEELPPSSHEISHETEKDILHRNYLSIVHENEKLKEKLFEKEKHCVAINSRNLELEKIVKDFQKKETFYEDLQVKISSIFSPNQLNLVLQRKIRPRWNADEISKAFRLRYLSKRAYIYVRQKLKYPLPGISTLQSWPSNKCSKWKSISENIKKRSKTVNKLHSKRKIIYLGKLEVKKNSGN